MRYDWGIDSGARATGGFGLLLGVEPRVGKFTAEGADTPRASGLAWRARHCAIWSPGGEGCRMLGTDCDICPTPRPLNPESTDPRSLRGEAFGLERCCCPRRKPNLFAELQARKPNGGAGE